MQDLIEQQKTLQLEESKQLYKESMANARQAWRNRSFEECEKQLDIAHRVNPHCDVVNRFRASVRSRHGRLDDALNDASRALASFPSNPSNHHAFAVASQSKGMLTEAGSAYLTSMKRGLPGSSEEIGFSGYLSTLRRHRHYYDELRPSHRKSVSGGYALARAPSRGSIFDPEKTLDEGGVVEEEEEVPDPPQLHLVRAEANSVTVGWYPDTSDGADKIPIYAYEVQMAQHDVVWEGSRFFDDFRPFEKVHRGGPDVTETTITGLRSDNKIICRVRAQSFGGFSDWNELLVSTLPPASRQMQSLLLPRKWLQLDIGELVPEHIREVGGEPKRFYLEIASCFAPHVRAIRRLFTGWSRAGLVGSKARQNELARQQFMRFCKEVGLCQGGGPMGKRSGAKLISANDVDRIFQRANIDQRASGNTRGAWSDDGLQLNDQKLEKVIQAALDELLAKGIVEEDAGEAELRERLRPIFDKFDEDGSGSVSTEEVGRMAESLKIEMSSEELQALMLEADPDGSGEIEFDELVAVLKKQAKEGGSLATLFDVGDADEDNDGGSMSMVLFEFVHALIRLAWECYPTPNAGIGARLNALMERAVLPGSAHLIDSTDPMEAELRSKRVLAVTAYYAEELKNVFNVFAAADVSEAGRATQETMSFPEVIFLAKHTEIIDANLTVAQLTALFAMVNNQAADDGEKDEDGDELSLSEFKTLLCRIANAKIPEKDRGGEPFEYTWHAFLQLIFLPKAKAIIRNMKRGLIDKTLG